MPKKNKTEPTPEKAIEPQVHAPAQPSAPHEPVPSDLEPLDDPLFAGHLGNSHIPESSKDEPNTANPATAPFDRTKVESKVIHNDQGQLDEILVGYSEPRDLPEEELTDEMELLGHAYGEDNTPTAESSKYQVAVMNSTMGSNLLIYPAIAAGRCTRCGPTRFVDKKNGAHGEVWKIVNRKNGEFRFVYRKGEWLEVDASNCPHYRNIEKVCSYCGEQFTGTKDRLKQFQEILGSRILWVFAERRNPSRLIMVCSDFRCKSKFDNDFHLNQQL